MAKTQTTRIKFPGTLPTMEVTFARYVDEHGKIHHAWSDAHLAQTFGPRSAAWEPLLSRQWYVLMSWNDLKDWNLGQRIANMELRQRRLVGVIETSEDDPEELLAALKAWRAQIAEAKAQRAELQDRRDELLAQRDIPANAEAEIARLRTMLADADEATALVVRAKLQRIVRSFIGMVRFGIDSGTVDVVLRDVPVAYRIQQSRVRRQRGVPRTYQYVGRAQAGYEADINRIVRAAGG
jgi:hypothetical protein